MMTARGTTLTASPRFPGGRSPPRCRGCPLRTRSRVCMCRRSTGRRCLQSPAGPGRARLSTISSASTRSSSAGLSEPRRRPCYLAVVRDAPPAVGAIGITAPHPQTCGCRPARGRSRLPGGTLGLRPRRAGACAPRCSAVSALPGRWRVAEPVPGAFPSWRSSAALVGGPGCSPAPPACHVPLPGSRSTEPGADAGEAP